MDGTLEELKKDAARVHALEQRVAEQAAQLQQRNAELAIISGVGLGLAKELDFQAIIDLVGDKIQEMFDGTEMRATYICIGDTVNLGARLETHTKVARQPILIDARTRAGLPDSIRVEAQGQVQLTGKTQAVQVFAVLRGA